MAVKVYENLSGIQAIPAVAHPFTDCSDIEVLKAFNAGIAMGTSATTFSPNDLLNRAAGGNHADPGIQKDHNSRLEL